MAEYEYIPLKSGGKEIRVFHLLPSSFSADIQIEMFTIDLRSNKAPLYEALSYVWGSTENRQNIEIRNGSQHSPKNWFAQNVRSRFRVLSQTSFLAVTRNLEVALRHMRRKFKSRLFWVDAICINQVDLVERSSEVARMGDIFSSAFRVVIWLGPESEDSSLAVKTIKSIASDLEFVDSEQYLYIKNHSKSTYLYYDSDAIRAKQADWIAVKNLYDREWFSRLWVLQEIGLSAQAIFSIGNLVITKDVFCYAHVGIWCYIAPYVTVFKTETLGHIQSATQMHRTNDVVALMNRTKYSLCSDPRDRVYAILSLIRDECKPIIVPDYQLSPEEVYRDFTLSCIDISRNLNILTLCSGHNGSLPSWVPDMSALTPTLPLEFGYASGNAAHNLYYPVDKRLPVRGVVVDTISSVGNALPTGAPVSQIIEYIRIWAPADLENENTLYKDGNTMLDAFLITLVGGLSTENTPPVYGSVPSKGQRTSFFYSCVRDGVLPGDTSKSEHDAYVSQLRFLYGRSFFTTAQGYIGICPADTKQDDLVCIILGCVSPLLLRPLKGHSDEYQLLGECYIPGLMTGEGLLGSIPDPWERHVSVGTVVYLWECDGEKTYEDPRLGALPSEWRRIYRDSSGSRMDLPFDDNGNLCESLFEQLETGLQQW